MLNVLNATFTVWGKCSTQKLYFWAKLTNSYVEGMGVRNGSIWLKAHAISTSMHSFDAAFKVEPHVKIYTSNLGLSLTI